MIRYIVTFTFSFMFYLALTLGSGGPYLWDNMEIALGVLVAFVASTVMSLFAEKITTVRIFNPIRWLMALVFMPVFLFDLAKANFYIAYRIITGRIKPGIVRIRTGFKTHLGTTILSNTITLTPGTLTLDVDERTNDLYVHWINVEDRYPKPEEVIGGLMGWVRRIAE